MKRLVTVLAAVLVLSSSTFAAAQSVTLRLGHDSPTTTAWHIGAMKIADLVKARSNGAVQIRVYPAAQLGDLRELVELTKAGTVDMVLVTAGVAANFVPSMNVFGLPFLFNDVEQARALYKGPLARQLMKDAEGVGLKGLGFNVLTFRSPMNNKRPLTSPADFQGLKIRLQQVPIHLDTYRALGASPVAIPYSEVYSAAQSGVIDGMENSPSGVYAPKFHEVMKNYSTLPVFINTSILYMSMKTWDRLTPEQRAVIEKAADDGNEVINQEYFRVDAEALQKMEAYGTKVGKGPFNLKAFREAVKPVYDKYVPQLPDSARKVVAELQKTWK